MGQGGACDDASVLCKAIISTFGCIKGQCVYAAAKCLIGRHVQRWQLSGSVNSDYVTT